MRVELELHTRRENVRVELELQPTSWSGVGRIGRILQQRR